MTDTDWLKTLKPGDEVALTGYPKTPEIGYVERITPTGQIVVRRAGASGPYSTRFWANGVQRGSAWQCRLTLAPVTPDIKADIQYRLDLITAQLTNWANLDRATLRRVVAALDAE